MPYIDVEKTLELIPDDLPYKASVKRVLLQAPAAEVEEVKHGRWRKGFCTECGELNPTDYLNEYTMRWKYRYLPRCPYCGARMDRANHGSSKE